MFALFSGRHVGAPWKYTNVATPQWVLKICAKYFVENLKFGKTHRFKTW